MLALSRAIDRLNDRIGRLVAWCALGIVLIQFTVVAMRYVFAAPGLFGLSSLWWQESMVYLFAAMIMLGMGYALRHDAHVRVDVFYARLPPRGKHLVDLFGALVLLLPMCALIFWAAAPDVATSWRVREGSLETSGIPLRYLLKTTILAMASLLALQGVAQALRAAHALRVPGEQRD